MLFATPKPPKPKANDTPAVLAASPANCISVTLDPSGLNLLIS